MIDRDMITDLTVRIDLIIIMGMDTVDLTIMAAQMETALDREMEMIMVVVLIDRVEIEIKLKKSNQLVAFLMINLGLLIISPTDEEKMFL
jgi:hypothetical protein